MDLFDRLKAAALPDWNAYVDHRFVRQMGEGTLPSRCFVPTWCRITCS